MRRPAELVRLLCASQGMSLVSLSLVAAALCCGCASFVTSDELPELPIAFVYHTEEEARRRAESLSDDEPKPYDPRSRSENRVKLA